MFDKVIEVMAWPIAVAVIAVLGMLIFRGPVTSLIHRTKKIGAGERGGIDFSETTSEKQQIEARAKAETTTQSIENHPLGPPSPSIAEVEKEVIARLTTLNEPGDMVTKRLIRGFAIAHLQKDFEILYRLIFGTQLDLLLAANAGGVTEAQARSMFETAKLSYPSIHENASFESWFKFPYDTGLLVRREDGRIFAADRGKEFMQYLVQTGLTAPKNNG